MANIARVRITNINMAGDYTASIQVGPQQKALNVILDTGSSALALDAKKYPPDLAGGDVATQLAQSDSYGDGSNWTGAVIQTRVTLGTGADSVTANHVNAAIAYDASGNMFGQADGILGLAYAPLDDAFVMPNATWPPSYNAQQVMQGQQTTVTPYLTQVAQQAIAAEKIAFFTQRSFVSMGNNPAINQGWLIVGGGEEATDLYSGAFQTAKVVADDWYNTQLKAILVGGSAHIAVRARGAQGMPSNSIVDSGTNSLNLGPQLLNAVLSKFGGAQRELLNASIMQGEPIPTASLGDLGQWPTLTFVLAGVNGDVVLQVAARDYWQVDAPAAGQAMAAITAGQEGLTILGLPLMNGYFTIFDGQANGGVGIIKFAVSKRG